MESLDGSLLHTDTAVDSINGDVNWFTKTGIDNTNEYVDLIISLVDLAYTPLSMCSCLGSILCLLVIVVYLKDTALLRTSTSMSLLYISIVIAGSQTCAYRNANGLGSQLLRPAEEAVHGRDGFRQKMKGLLKGTSDLQAKTKEELEQQITKYQQDDDSLEERAVAAMNGATQSRNKYETNRKSGRKKFGRKAQLFVRHFAEFMQCYSGVIEVLKGAGQMYGIVAYETLSIFLVV